MKILNIEKGSIAEELGIKAGDYLLSINGNKIDDKLDYQFYSADEELTIVIDRDQQEYTFEIERDFDEEIGLELEALKFRTCGNNCVFCFVYQNPDGLRPSLYIKDEDFRLSFLYGNYTTLTNAKKRDLEKIVEQRLSPQYVSIHATDIDARKILLGTKKDDKLLEKLKYLTENNVEVHGQIVLCPEINDGDILHKTIADLLNFYPMFQSVAIVPLGLTKHREGLMQLRSPDKEYSRRFIEEIDLIREKLVKKYNNPFVYLSDEWYLKAELEIPNDSYYDNFYQVENGVGICREFINSVNEQSDRFPERLEENRYLELVTAPSAGIILEKYLLPKLKKIKNLNVNLTIIKNNFYGQEITVSGLLTAKDIYEQLPKNRNTDLFVLPPRCLNPDGFFLDNWSLADLEEKLNTRTIIYEYDMVEILNSLAG